MGQPDGRKNYEFSVLFVGDPNLGYQGLQIVRRYFEHVTDAIWTKGDKEGKKTTRELIRSRDWDICISFYNDLVFTAEDLSHMRVPINIHPSAPSLPGVGYDTLPLVEGHSTYGITCHYVTEKVDDGKIICVLEKELPGGITYTNFRPLTQELCLEMLELIAKDMSGTRSLSETANVLDARSAQVTATWSKRYVSKTQLAEMLDQLRKSEPDHPVFK